MVDNNYNIPLEQPSTDEGPGLTLDNTQTMSPALADQRSSAAAYGLGDKVARTKDQYMGDFVSGQEKPTRDWIVDSLAELDSRVRVQNLIAKMKSNVEHAQDFGRLVDELGFTQNDPNSVIEDHFSQKYMNELRWPTTLPDNSSWVRQATEQWPDDFNAQIAIGHEYMARKEFWRSAAQDAEEGYNRQSWPSWLVDQAKEMTTLYPLIKMHVPGTSWFQLPGEAQDEARRQLMLMPYEDMKTLGTNIMNSLDPTERARFAKNMLDYSTSDRWLDNVLPIVQPGVEVGAIAGLIGRQVAINQVRTAARQMIQREVDQRFPQLAASLNSGNVQAAVRQMAWGDRIRRLRRADPVQDAIDDMPALFKVGRQKLVEEAEQYRSVGVEPIGGTQQLIDQYDQIIKEFPDMVATLTRPERTPALEEGFEPAIEAAQQMVRDQNKSLTSRLWNTSRPYRVDPFTRNWFVDMILGRTSQEPFGTRAEAGRAAKLMGLDGHSFVGDDIHYEPQLTGLQRTAAEMAAAERFNTEAEARTYAESHGITNYTVEGKPRSVGETVAHLERPEDLATAFRSKDFGEAGYIAPGSRDVHVVIPGVGKKVFKEGKAVRRGKDSDLPVTVIPGKVEKSRGKWWVPTKGGAYAPFDELHGGTFEPSTTPIVPGAVDPESGFRLNIAGTGDKVRAAQSGSGWYIVKPVAVSETDPAMRAFYAHLDNDRIPKGGVLNSFLSRLRTPNETLSEWMNRNREAATFASSVIQKYAYDEAEAIRKITPNVFRKGKGRWDDFERILNEMQEIRDKQGKIGYTFDTVGELQYQYMRVFSRLPDEQEVAAYFAFKRINEMDHALRTIAIIRNKYRDGVMSHKFFTMRGMEKYESPEFDGIPLAHFPTGHTGSLIAIVGDTPNDIKLKLIGRLGNARGGISQGEYWEHKVTTGEYKVVEVHNPSQRPLAGYGPIDSDKHLEFVLVKSANMSNKPLNWTSQLPFRGGGHFSPKANQYLAQIAMTHQVIDGEHHWFATGVNKLMPVINGVEGRAVLGHFERIRQFLQKTTPENLAAARDIVENTLHMNWDDVYRMFRSVPRRGADGRMGPGQPPLFNLTEPFQMVDANKNLIAMDREGLESRYPKGQFTDATRRGDKALQYATQFAQERDVDTLYQLMNDGTVSNPAYRWGPAPLVSAIPMMQRAMAKISNTFLMDEMKQHAVENWVREASSALKAGGLTESELQSSPLFAFHRGDLKPSVEIDASRISELETARMQTKQFLGQVSEADAVSHLWAQKLADTIYSVANGRYYTKYIDPISFQHFAQDPTRQIRGLTFHLKMGLMSIPQIFVQGQTYTNILGIAGPVRAAQGTFGALMWQYSRFTSPAAIGVMDKYASKMGWKEGQLFAALQDAKSTGFLNVGQEYAIRDNPMNNKLITTAWGKFLDMGAIPFTEGSRSVRAGAWFTAWKERAENTGRSVMTNEDKLWILDRASLLDGNMNRASNAMYQRGWTALPAQFMTYTIRQAELIWGKRLTPWEKGRLLIANAMMYGLPVGLGMTGFPSDLIRQKALQYGYNPGDNYVTSMITEGVPSTIMSLTNGGTFYNVGERFGNTGATPIYDIMYGDKTLWDMTLGAAAMTTGSLFQSMDPFYRKVIYTLSGDPNGFQIMPEHFYNIAKEASSVSNLSRAAIAALTGKLITRKGDVLSDKMDLFSSILMGATGLQPQEASDIFLMENASKAEKQVQEWGKNRFIQEFHRGLEAYDNKDNSNGESFMTNAFAYMDMFAPEDEKTAWLTQASDNWQSIIDRVKESFAMKHVPPGLEENRLQSWIRGIQRGQ